MGTRVQAPEERQCRPDDGCHGPAGDHLFSGITVLSLMTNVHIAENTCDLVGFPGNCDTDPPAYGHRADRSRRVRRPETASGSSSSKRRPHSSSSSPRTPPSTASPCSARSWLRIVYCQGNCTRAATASLLQRHHRVGDHRRPPHRGLRRFGDPADPALHSGRVHSFTLSQFGMVRHWNRALVTEPTRGAAAHSPVALSSNAFGGCLTALVLVIVMVHEVHAWRLPRRHRGFPCCG
jgi:hypothetical protein